jgi:hypothetical protein
MRIRFMDKERPTSKWVSSEEETLCRGLVFHNRNRIGEETGLRDVNSLTHLNNNQLTWKKTKA